MQLVKKSVAVRDKNCGNLGRHLHVIRIQQVKSSLSLEQSVKVGAGIVLVFLQLRFFRRGFQRGADRGRDADGRVFSGIYVQQSRAATV